MIARRLTTILPAMILAEALDTTCIHRVAGLTGNRTAWVATRHFALLTTPFRIWG
jgi:predicted ATPase with chaperone activity